MPPQPSRTAAGPSAVLAAVAAFPDRLRRRAPLSRVCALAAAMLLAIPAVQAQTYTLRVRGGGSGFGGVTVPPTGGQAGMNCAIASGIAAGTCARTYARSTAVTLTATPLAGSVFAGWAGVCASAGSASRCTVSNLTGNVSAVATFEPDCTVTILAASGGSATFADGTPSGACGRSVTVVATPAAGYRFDRWSDGATAATYTFIVASRALVLTPAFVAQCSLTLGASPATGGTVALTSGTLGGDCGRSVSVQATPSPLYRFSAFTEGGGTASTVNPWSFTLATNRSVVATFAAVPQCALTLGTAPGGAATLVSGALTGDCGRAVSLQARPDSGFRFRSWSDGTTTTPYTLTLTAPTLTLTPEFTAQCTLVLAALPADGGTVTLSSGTLTGDCGRSVTAVATARSDFRFTGWSEASASATYTLTVTQSRQPLSAQFASLTSVRVVISGAQGRVLRGSDGTELCALVVATEVTCSIPVSAGRVTAAPGAESGFTGWRGACSGRGQCVLDSIGGEEVKALFVPVRIIPADTAALDLLTGAGLTPSDRDVLDQAGNGDGVYNLGDLLAHLERTNQVLSPKVSAQVLSAASPPRQPIRRARPAMRP